ncbi:MAG: purine-nucleoside phosphorylase [Planctomycetes bacterium]|nr:purine-nucleoside phosphorylase [Planctomycetota bacterium]
MNDLKSKITAAVKAIRTKVKSSPRIGIILGTGLGNLTEKIKNPVAIPYNKVPHFPESTVVSHKNELVFGTIAGKDIVALGGRFHIYEGYSPEQITLPVRVVKALGAEILIVSNASGGLNPHFSKGDIVIIEDHINFMGVNPLIGPNDDSLGPRFPDMSRPYDPELIRLAEKSALEKRIKTHKGVYVAVTGPNLETRAEYRLFRNAGADCVGMSTVPEVITAVHCGLRVLGISIITDICLPDALEPANIKEIIAIANNAEPKMTELVTEVIGKS